MTFNALKHGDVSQVQWMFEGSIGFVAGITLTIGEAAQIDGMLNGYGFDNCRRPR